MKKRSIITATLLTAMCIPAFSLPVHAMDWRDGAQASQTFTYVGTSEGIKAVHVQDKNGTVNATIQPGTSVTSKTGTITWRDSYENVTSFYVDVTAGYDVKVLVNGQDGELFDTTAPIDVKVNSDLGKDNTYTLDGMEGYEKVFYFSSAGKEAWVKNPGFSFETEKIPYTLSTKDGKILGTTAIGEVPQINEKNFEIAGNSVTGYTINGIAWKQGEPITEEMIKNASAYNNQLQVEAQYQTNSYQVTINYYDGGMISRTPSKTETATYEYGSTLDRTSLQLSENQYIVGADEITVQDEDLTINIVSRPTTIGYKEWAFTYVGEKDAHVQGVTAQWNWDNSTDTSFNLNETAILYTPGAVNGHIKFFVSVDNGYEPTGKLSDGKDATFTKISENDGFSVYQMEFTRGADHTLDKSPVFETFTIETVPAAE